MRFLAVLSCGSRALAFAAAATMLFATRSSAQDPPRTDTRATQSIKPDLLVTSVWAGPASTNRLCIGATNRLYVTVRRQGGAELQGPISVWLTARSLTGTLPAGRLQKIDYVTGANSWLVIFRDVPVSLDWRALQAFFTVTVNPEVDGTRAIVESNYNNNSYTLQLREHTDWSRKCT